MKQAVGHGCGGGGRHDLLRLARVDAARSIEVTHVFQRTPTRLGLATVLWCYLRNPAFKTAEKDYHTSPPISPARRIISGVTIEADIIKQKMPD